jgi:hypothetical protein
MKKIKYILILLLAFAGMTSCEEENDLLTEDKNVGGLVRINDELVGYVVGNGNTYKYTASFSVFQSEVKTEKIDIYKSFTNTDGKKSNEVLFRTINLSTSGSGTREVKEITFTYDELIADLKIEGGPIPSDDTKLNIGDAWTLRYVSKITTGKFHTNYKSTKVSVGTRFAGKYRVLDAQYYRIGVIRPDVTDPFIGKTINIESINSTLYRLNEYFGPFDSATEKNELYFTIDPTDKITYPSNKPDGSGQTGNSQPLMTCESQPNEMTNVKCATSNFVTRDDISGKDKLTMSFGYLNAPGAPREFYQVLQKL